MAGGEFAVLFHYLKRKRGGGQSQRGTRKERRLPASAQRHADPRKGKRRQNDLCRTKSEDRLAHGPQTLGPKLQANQKQKKNDTEIRDLAELLGVVGVEHLSQSEGTKQDPSSQIAKHRRHTQRACQGCCHYKCRQHDRNLCQFHPCPISGPWRIEIPALDDNPKPLKARSNGAA